MSNLISVVLGIVITFSVQGLIDRFAVRKEVRSALELVRTELSANKEDIGVMADYLVQERRSAEYFLSHRHDLSRCPSDSTDYHSGVILADASITLSRDALEMMTMSSLFQKIGDGPLAMKIIRAYDTCGNIVSSLNQHIAARDARFEGSVNEKTVGKYASGGSIDMAGYLKTDYGLYSVRWLTTQVDPARLADVSDIDAALDAINAYLQK